MDSKVISFSDVLLRSIEKETGRSIVLDAVVLPEITEIIRKAGLDPMKFFLDELSLKQFMELSITHREVDDSFCSVYYDSCTPNVLYRAECRITFEGEDVYADTNLFKLEDYQSGNREWLWFCDSDWEQGPGEDFFDIEDVIHK